MLKADGICVVAAAVVTVLASHSLPAASPITIEVAAGAQERIDVPVFLQLPAAYRQARKFRLERLDGGDPAALPVQWEAGDPPHVVWMLTAPLPAGKTRRYRLTAEAGADDSAATVRCIDDGRTLRITVGDRPVLTYNVAATRAPDRTEAYYDRSGFLHPVFSPSGRVITDDLNPDHMHQHGIMLAWRQCAFDGHAVDFWDERSQLGKIEHLEVASTGSGPVFGHFTARLAHNDLTGPAGPKPVLHETWRVRVYNRTDLFVFDLESEQGCATEDPLIVKKFHYGGMAVRASKQWKQGEGFNFLTSEGKSRADGNHTRARWCAIAGTIDEEPAGLTMLCHPNNFRFPQPVRLHPKMPYYCWAPMVHGAFRIEPGQPFVSRYRFVVFDGKPDAARMEPLWRDYAEPVAVRVVR